MAVDQRELQADLDQVFAGQEALEACRRRDIGAIIRVLGKHGITQGRIASLTGIAQGRLSEYKTGKRIPTASSTFEAFADGLGMPAPARRALGLAPTAETEPTSAGDVTNVQEDPYEIQLLAAAVGKVTGTLNRREMLELAAAIGTAATLGRNDVWDRLSFAITKPVAVDESIVREMEERSAGYHQLDLVMPGRALYKSVMAHLRELSTLLNGTANDPANELRRRLIVVAGESAALAGWWASDAGDMTAARNLYKTAEQAAEESQDASILACLLGYRSYAPSMKGAHGRSRALLTTALETLPKSVSPTTESWLAARHAEESAALGDKRQALNSWGRAEEAFSIADPEEDRVWVRFFDQNRFDSCRVSTYANIPGKLDKAEEIANDMLASLADFEHKRIVIVLSDIAAAHLRHGHTNEACRIAKDGLVALRESEFATWLPKFEELAKAVSPWRKNEPVRTFLDEFAITKRQFSFAR